MRCETSDSVRMTKGKSYRLTITNFPSKFTEDKISWSIPLCRESFCVLDKGILETRFLCVPKMCFGQICKVESIRIAENVKILDQGP